MLSEKRIANHPTMDKSTGQIIDDKDDEGLEKGHVVG